MNKDELRSRLKELVEGLEQDIFAFIAQGEDEEEVTPEDDTIIQLKQLIAEAERRKKMGSKWKYIILHHSLTKDGKTVDWQAIRRYHTQVRGWDDIGYHFGVEWVMGGYEILIGRTLDKPGAHTLGKNGVGIGVCCLGNFDNEALPEEMIDRLIPLLKWLRKEYQIPRSNIVGHNAFASYKSCPGRLFDIEEIRRRL